MLPYLKNLSSAFTCFVFIISLKSSFQSSNDYWWPNRLDLSPLRQNDKDGSSPYGPDFDYAREFESLDLEAVKNDLTKLMTTPQEWWPPDFGHYGPFFIRMAWHSAGTYRVIDGRGGVGGGQQRFEPLNSWPDNVNLDKARRLLLPIKQKYGRKLSWADLMILAGNVALETMGFNVLGFGGGRKDNWQADMTYWGSEKQWLKSERRDGNGELEKPLAAVQMGLIYVNPEGPNGNPDPLASARSIRESFGLMAMNDEETVALIVGGHSFGKAHGAASAERNVGPAPAAENIEHQGFGWRNGFGSGRGPDTISSGLEGAWTPTPTRWSPMYLQNLLGSEWNLTRSPAGATQWTPAMMNGVAMVPDAHREWKRHLPMMFTSDMALKMDPTYRKISERFRQNPAELEDAFAKAWFKLTHRDMGPLARYKGQDVPKKTFVWQDPIPERTHELINDQDIIELKSDTMTSGLPITDLVFTAWASASTFRKTDKRGGANGARISMEPQKNWQVNDPKRIARVIEKLKEIQNEFHRRNAGSGKKVSLADLIVLAGCAAVEAAARAGGKDVKVKFDPGRMDARESETDAASFSFLEPKFDGFRNYHDLKDEKDPKKEMIEKAAMLSLTVPETVVLVGGMRVLGANTGLSKHGVFTDRPGVLTNDFFKNLIDMDTVWTKTSAKPDLYEGRSRSRTRALKWTATAVDLIFGHNSELRAVVEVYGSDDAEQMFLDHFTKAWSKVMNLDRFDL